MICHHGQAFMLVQMLVMRGGDASLFDVNGYNSSGNNPFSYSPKGSLIGVHLGYEKLFRKKLVLGAEARGGYDDLSGSRQYPPYIGVRGSDDSVAHTKDGGFISLLGRLGFVIRDKILFYGLTGWTWSSEHSFIDTNATGITLSNITKPSRDAWLTGAGIEYAFRNKWSARFEYDHQNYGSVTSSGLGSDSISYRFRHKLISDGFQIGISRFI